MTHIARKRFGQNFLIDQRIIDDIVAAVAPQPGQYIVEIGPGTGALTRRLLQSGAQLHVVELDRDLVAKLQQDFAATPLQIHSADALRFDFSQLAREAGGPLRVVGNLPYNISTPLLFHLMEQSTAISDMHFMLQKEVVDRLAAPPDCKAYGKLSVLVQARCNIEVLFDVPPTAFRPVPKVLSSVFRCQPWPVPPVEIKDFAIFSRVVSAAFAHRRKTLRNNLQELLSAEQFARAGIDAGRRAESLSLQDFARLAATINVGEAGGR